MYPANTWRGGQPRTTLHITHRQDRTSRECLDNAHLAAHMAGSAVSLPDASRYRQIEDSWRALAAMQDWLDGIVHPIGD